MNSYSIRRRALSSFSRYSCRRNSTTESAQWRWWLLQPPTQDSQLLSLQHRHRHELPWRLAAVWRNYSSHHRSSPLLQHQPKKEEELHQQPQPPAVELVPPHPPQRQWSRRRQQQLEQHRPRIQEDGLCSPQWWSITTSSAAAAAAASASRQREEQRHMQSNRWYSSSSRMLKKDNGGTHSPPKQTRTANTKNDHKNHASFSSSSSLSSASTPTPSSSSSSSVQEEASADTKNEAAPIIQTFSHHPIPTSSTISSQPIKNDNQDWEQFTMAQQYRQQLLTGGGGGDGDAEAGTTADRPFLHPPHDNNDDAVFSLTDPYIWPGSHKDLFQPDIHLATAPQDWTGYEKATLLWKELAAWIGVTGKPLSMADYMRLCLTHPQYGYYTRAVSNSATVDDFDAMDDDDDIENDNNTTDKGGAADPGKTTKKKPRESNQQMDARSAIGGDFVTAPELSQMFGESLGIWIALTAQQQERQPMVATPTTNTNGGRPTAVRRTNWKSGWQYVEAGPGKGTLLLDLLRCWNQLALGKEVGKAVIPSAIHLLETSPRLRQVQKERLQQSFGNIEDNDNDDNDDNHEFVLRFVEPQPHQHNNKNPSSSSSSTMASSSSSSSSASSNSTNIASTTTSNTENEKSDMNKTENGSNNNNNTTTTTAAKKVIPVYWHDNLLSLQAWQLKNESFLPTFCICQEFLDALPIYAFEKTKQGTWRERMVDIAMQQEFEQEQVEAAAEEEAEAAEAAAKQRATTGSTSPAAAAPVQLPPQATSTSSDNTDGGGSSNSSSKTPLVKEKPRLRIVLAPEETQATKILLRLTDKGLLPSEAESGIEAPVGSVVEVNPEAVLFVQDLAKIIGQQGGGALIVDYGQEGSRDSIRAFGQHQQVHFLSQPGLVDVTADVDFAALKHAVNHVRSRSSSSGSLNKEGTMKDGESSSSSSSNEGSSTTAEPAGGEARAYGPVAQGVFLMAMGIKERAIQLCESIQKQAEAKASASKNVTLQQHQKLEDETSEQIDLIYQALVRLCSADEMGQRFKVMAIVPTPPKDDNAFFQSKPPGF